MYVVVYNIVFAMDNESYYESIIAGKRLENTVTFKIAIDYEMKFKNYFTSSFWLNLFEFIVQYVYIIYL